MSVKRNKTNIVTYLKETAEDQRIHDVSIVLVSQMASPNIQTWGNFKDFVAYWQSKQLFSKHSSSILLLTNGIRKAQLKEKLKIFKNIPFTFFSWITFFSKNS